MGLICNGYRLGHMPHNIATGTLTTIYQGRAFRDMAITGRLRNITAGEGITSDKVGVPMGYLHPGAWIMPQKPGNLSSHNATLGSATATLALVKGRNIGGLSSGTSEAEATARLVVAMSGTSAGAGSATGAIAAILNMSGVAAGGSTAEGATTALAWCRGTAAGVATGTLGSYATGALAGHVYVNTGTAQIDQLVNGVWNALMEDYQEVGSAGKAMTSAGSAGDPWSSVTSAYTDDATFGAYMKKLLTTGKFLALK